MAKRTISIALLVAMLVSIFSIPAVAQVHEDEYLAACIHSYENFSENFDTTRLYLNALDRINSSRIIEWMLNKSAWVIEEDLSVERCVGILSNLASAINLRMEDQIIAQADYDTTKTWVEYTQDVSDIVSGAIGIDDELQGKLLDTLKDCISYDGIVISFLGDSIDSVNLFYNLAGDYRMQYDFLMNVKRYSELENMREAAGILLRCNEKLMLAKLEGIASVSENLAEKMGKDIFLDSMSKDLIQEFIDGDEVDQALAFGFGCYNEIMDKIINPAEMYFKLGIFAGDMLFGTSNIFNRYTEMTALKDIRNANLRAIEKNPVASAKDSLEAIEKNRNAYYCILGADLRGEYCLNQMLTSEGQLLSVLNLGNRDAYNDQYDDTYFIIKAQFAHLDGLIPDRSNFDYEEPESEVQEEMPSSENQLRTIFTQQCSETILSWVYDDFDGDGIYEAYVLTTDGTDNNVWLTTTGGVQLAMNAGNAGWDSETPLTAGRYKFMVLTQCEPVPTMYYAKHYLFTVSNGTVYQPDISGQEGIFGHNGQAGYDQLAADEAEYETPVTDAYYSCKWRGYGPDGQIPWENIRYYDFDESSIQFVEKQENAAAEPESPPENSTIPTASEESAASAWPELTDYYWYRNVQSWEVYEFRDDGTFQVYYTEMPLTPSENTQLSQADLVSSGQSGRYDFDGEKLTIYPDDGASYSMDLYDRSRDPYPDDDAAQYVSDYDGSIYFYETDWEPVEIAGILVTDHSYLVRLGKKA